MIRREEKDGGRRTGKGWTFEFVRVHTYFSSSPSLFHSSGHKFAMLLCLRLIDANGVLFCAANLPGSRGAMRLAAPSVAMQ